jgi:hypothetical protein
MARTPFQQAMDLIQSEYFAALRHREAQLKSTPRPGQPPDPHRIELEARIRRQVDNACLAFAKHPRLPAMTPERAVFVYDRFDSGYELCNWALRNDVQFPRKSVGGLLKLFLVEFWFYSGHLRWRSGWRGVLP